MEENINITQTDLFKDMEAFSKKPEEPIAGLSTSSSEWLSLLASQGTKETSSQPALLRQDKNCQQVQQCQSLEL